MKKSKKKEYKEIKSKKKDCKKKREKEGKGRQRSDKIVEDFETRR